MDNETQEHERLVRQLGAYEERYKQLQQTVASQQSWQSGAQEWQRLQIHRRDLAEWLVDRATNESHSLTRSVINAGLCGELFVPGSFNANVNGRRYRFDLVSTQYEIREIAENG